MTFITKVGQEFVVNTEAYLEQWVGESAKLRDGGFVMTWHTTDYYQDHHEGAIKAQIFNHDGTRRGDEFLVNWIAYSNQLEPTVTGLSDGNFVVAWQSAISLEEAYGGTAAIKAQIFDPTGRPLDREFFVNTNTAGNQSNPSVTALNGGRFVATWTTYETDNSGYPLYRTVAGQIFDNQGAKIGDEFDVVTGPHVAGDEHSDPHVIQLTNGRFVIAWTTENAAAGVDLWMQVFNGDGTLFGSQIAVNTDTTGNQWRHDIVALAGGGFVATWQTGDVTQDGDGYAIKGQVFDANGESVGGEFVVNSQATASQDAPSVAALENGGFFIVWRTTDDAQDGFANAVKGQLFDETGAKIGREFLVNSEVHDSQVRPEIAAVGGDRFIVSWHTDDRTQDGSGSAVKAQIFDVDATPAPELLVNQTQVDETQVGNVLFARLSSDALNGDFTYSIVSDPSGAFGINGNWLVLSENRRLDYETGHQVGLTIRMTDPDGAFYDRDITLDVIDAQDERRYEAGNEFRVNTETLGWQHEPSISALSNGAFVAAWQTNLGIDIKARVFSATGTPLGSEIAVNSETLNWQEDPVVVGLTSGRFVVTWQTDDTAQDGSRDAVKARMFNNNGTGYSSEFLVNTYALADQYAPTAAALTNGGFVISWSGNATANDGSYYAVKAQIYDSTGSPVGTEFLVNTEASLIQENSSITGLTNGGFVAVWETNDRNQDGSGMAIKGQVFSALGAKVGGEILINTDFAFDQDQAVVQGLSNGRFVVVWRTGDPSADGSGSAIKGQIFDATGTKIGSEFLINTHDADDQLDPAVTDLSGGRFVVSWRTWDYEFEGSASSISAQIFDGSGVKLGSEFIVNNETTLNQYQPVLAGLNGGNFVAGWTNIYETIPDSALDVKARVFTPSLDFGFAETGKINLDDTAQTITLQRSYFNPVVMAFAETTNDNDPVNVRVSGVLGDQLTLQLQEPGNNDGIHGFETVNYLVVEAGNYVMPDGSLLEARTLNSNLLSSQGFETVQFDAEFDTTPIVLSQVQSFNGSDFVTTRQRRADADSFQLTMQEEEAKNDGSHITESIGWIAFEDGASHSGLIDWSVGRFPAITHDPTTVESVDLRQNDANLIGVVSSFSGGDPVWLRAADARRQRIEISLQEDTSDDPETSHVAETVDYFAFSGNGGFLTEAPRQIVLESGSAQLTDDTATVSLSANFVNPVAVAFVATVNGAQAVNVRISGIIDNELTLELQEPNNLDGAHIPETVTYVVAEAGSWVLPDGTLFEAGLINSSLLSPQGSETVAFASAFETAPVVLSHVQTFNGTDFVNTRQNNATATGFEVTMQEEQALNAGGHVTETIGWIAIEGGTGLDGAMAWVAGKQDGLTHSTGTVTYEMDLGDDAFAVAGLGTLNGSDPAWVRGSLSFGTGFSASVAEDTSADDETNHVAETLNFLAFNQSGVITGYDDALFVV